MHAHADVSYSKLKLESWGGERTFARRARLTDGRSRYHLRSSPSQYPTPRESKEGSRIATPFFPRSREAVEFFWRGNPVTRNRSLQSLIPAFRGAVVREGDSPIRGAIADIVGGGLDAIKSRLLKQPAQATTCIRFGNSLARHTSWRMS